MKKKTTLASWLLSVLVVAGFVGFVKADLTPTGTVIRQIFDGASGVYGKYRIIFDGSSNNYAIFGSSQAPSGNAVGAVVMSSGSFVAQSTSTTAEYKFFELLNNAGVELLSLTQAGNLTLKTGGHYLGDGSTLSGLPGTNATVTWLQPQYFTSSVNISSPTSSLVVGSSASFNGAVYGIASYYATWLSTDTNTNSNYAINLAGASQGTLNYLKGTTIPATAICIYSLSIKTISVPGSPAGANNAAVSISATTQNFLANVTKTINCGNNASSGYTASCAATFVCYDP